jgi:hypothetical protein
MKKTNFYIYRNNTIREIQDSFSHFYPSLELNFFSNNEKIQSINSCVMFSPEVRIRDISPGCLDGFIELNDIMTMGELENSIHDHFALHAEISSKTENRPITIPRKQHWIFEQKNSEGVRLPERSHPAYF